jgi:hypothetical protein
MEYIINVENLDFKIILFQLDSKNWEICIDPSSTEEEIQILITRRIDELTNDFLINGNYEKSDLFVDYIDYEKNN